MAFVLIVILTLPKLNDMKYLSPIMNLRLQFFEYCDTNFAEMLSRLITEELKFRLVYTMMFTAFEVKNDMEASVKYFEHLNLNFLL